MPVFVLETPSLFVECSLFIREKWRRAALCTLGNQSRSYWFKEPKNESNETKRHTHIQGVEAPLPAILYEYDATSLAPGPMCKQGSNEELQVNNSSFIYSDS